MCLTAYKKNCFKYAKEDIVCYKVLYKYSLDYGIVHYVTPYMKYNIDESIIKGEEPYKAIGRGVTRWAKGMRDVIGGYIHVYSTKLAAVIASNGSKTLKVYECIIPKGTRYAEGFFGPNTCYAAKQIIFKNEVK